MWRHRVAGGIRAVAKCIVRYINGIYILYQQLNSSSNVLYTSVCGYDTAARQRGKKQQQDSDPVGIDNVVPAWKRRAAYNFTGCLAHADVTYSGGHGTVVRIIGYFHHNEGCQGASLVRYPRVPIHPHVYEVALSQLRCGAR